MIRWTRFCVVLMTATLFVPAASPGPKTKKIVLIAGQKSHGPGAHEYVKSARLLKVLLDRSPDVRGVRTEVVLNGWPTDAAMLEDAATIVMMSDGEDGKGFRPVPFMTPERMEIMTRLMKGGCGLVLLHFSTFSSEQFALPMLEWIGGYFKWQGEPGGEWYSKIKILDAGISFGDRPHPITRGVKPFRYKDEFYYRIRFRDGDSRLKPVLLVPELGGPPQEHTVAWAVERTDGGRGFGATFGHFYDNWRLDDFRKVHLNAIAWTARLKIPSNGIRSVWVGDEEVDRSLCPASEGQAR